VTSIEKPLTARELADFIGLHPVTILRWARTGRIPCRKLSAKKVVFLPSQIQEWLNASPALYTPDSAVCAASTDEHEEAA